MSTDPSKTSGQFHASKGGMKETLGNMMGSTTLQQHGQEEHAAGQAEENQAKTQGYVEGLKDRVAGAKDSMLGSMTGDKSKQAQGNLRRDKGETQQDTNRNV
ncbi:hypothetical protein Ac2012v2_006400 [Leucoagaricus gongylophorus]